MLIIFLFWFHKGTVGQILIYFCHSCVKTEKLAERGDWNKFIILYVSRDSEKTCLNSFSACRNIIIMAYIFPRSYGFHYYFIDYSVSFIIVRNLWIRTCNLFVSTFVTTLSNLNLIYRILWCVSFSRKKNTNRILCFKILNLLNNSYSALFK